jgi:cytochrome c oxidase subunit 2
MARRSPGHQPDGALRGRLARMLPVLGLLSLTLLLASCTDDPQSTIPQGGPVNAKIWTVYNFLWIGAAVVFVLVEGLLVFTIFRFRHAPRTAHGRPVPVHGNTRLEIMWTIIPAIVLVVIAVPTLSIIADLANTPEDDNIVRVDVIGNQFFFAFEYPDFGVRTTNTLHIPEDTVIDINLQSNDVIHSFWVPHLAGKTDNVPGRTNTMWLEADDPGEYHGQCAEFCGIGHALMKFTVQVHTQAEFDSWVQEQQAGGGSEEARRGQQLADANGCTGCHTVDGSEGVGPTWQGLFGSEVTLADGSTVTADEAYITESIRNPSAKVAEGFPDGVMPTFDASRLSDEDIQAIIAYIETLVE